MIVDAHNHLLLSHAGWDGEEPRTLPLAAMHDRLRRGGVAAIGLVVGGDRAYPHREPASAWEGTLDALAQWWRGWHDANGGFVILSSGRDLARLTPARPGVLLGIEGVGPCFDAPLDDPIAALHVLFRLGVRSLQLLGGPSSPAFEAVEPSGGRRLTDVGRDILREANRLGMVIDLAHMTADDPALLESIALSSPPPIASHHSCRSVTGLDGALSDDGIRAVAHAGGVIGIHTGSQWLRGSDRQGTIDELMAHIEHVVDLAGVNHVGLGTDHVDRTAVPMDLPHDLFMAGFEGPESFGVVAAALETAGFGATERRKILGDNVLRVWREALDCAKRDS